MIIVEYKSDVVGNGELWRGSESDISMIRNVVARDLAKRVVKDGKEHKDGMWTVRKEGMSNV